MDNFDDVVVEIKYESGEEYLYALQLKHRAAKEDILSTESFNADKGKFGLNKYYNGFKKIQETFKDSKAYNIPFKNFYFILYTNQILQTFTNNNKETDELKLQSNLTIYRHDKCVARNLLNLSENDSNFIYKFKSDTKNDFLNQFYLYARQKDAQQMECLISKTIFEIFKISDATIITKYINFFKCWWRGDFGNYKLTKNDIILKLAEYILTPHIPEPNFEIAEETILLSEIFAKFDIIVVDDYNLEIERRIWSTVTQKPGFSSTFFFTEETKIPIAAQGENFIEHTSKKIYTILWHMDKVPLIIKVFDKFREEIYLVIKLLEKHKLKKRFVIIDETFAKNEFTQDLKILCNLEDLKFCEKTFTTICKELTVSLQGRPCVTIDQLVQVGNQFLKILTTSKILKMLDKCLVIGEDCSKSIPKHYINRFTPKILLTSQVVDKLQDDLFVVSCTDFKKHQFSIKTYELNKYLVNQSFGKFVIVNAGLCSKQQFHLVCELNNDRNCHHIRILDDGKIEWIESFGSTRGLRVFLDFNKTDFVKDFDILEHYTNKINIICADPGMGKSIMLNFLQYKCSSDYWVIKIDLNDHIQFFKKVPSLEEALNYFLNYKSSDKFIKQVVSVFLNRKKLIFMWDGFDELPNSCVTSLITLIKTLAESGYQQWISSRNNSRLFLENMFSSLSLTITHFSEEDQQKYIYNTLKNIYDEEKKVEDMTLSFHRNINSFLHCGFFNYSGIPLHINMAIEIFLKNPQKYLKEVKMLILTDVYQEYIDEKFYSLFRRANANSDNHLMKIIQEKFKNTQVFQYETAALKASFDESVFSTFHLDCTTFLEKIVKSGDRLGLISGLNDEKKPIFTHKTYEEFLTASWLVKNYHICLNLSHFIFKEDYKNIRFMFDMILAKESQVHIAVLYRNINILNKHKDEIFKCRDKGGRTALHIACSWGNYHKPIKILKNRKTVIIPESDTFVQNDNGKLVDLLLALKCDPFEKDKVFGWNSVDYSHKTFSLASIEAMLAFHYKIDLCQLDNFEEIFLLYYSVKCNYQNLFQQLRNFPYFTIHFSDGDTSTLLQFAVEMDRLDFIKTLLTYPHHQKEINKSNKHFGSLLISALSNKNLEMFKILKTQGADIKPNKPLSLIASAAFAYESFWQGLLEKKRKDSTQ